MKVLENAYDDGIPVKTTGVKLDAGKAPINLIPSEFITLTAQVFNFGGKKYGNHNFRMGIGYSRLLDAAMRHLLAYNQGEELDPESGLPHLGHASASIAMLVYMQAHHPALNDIYEQIKERK
jgi:hypothetical protein